jgi:1,4-dihydroxy-2-naphthoyl-CoA hydrolase
MTAPDPLGGFHERLGVEFDELTADRVTLRLDVRPELFQPYGIVHGGVYCTLVETAASVAAGLWFGERGQVVGVANHTNFLRATRSGTLTAVATPIHRGHSQQLWLVEVSDDTGKLAARGEVRLANLRGPAKYQPPDGSVGERSGRPS